MTCPNCGTENTNDSKLCAKCGKTYDNENNNKANNLTTNTENITPQNKTSNTKISFKNYINIIKIIFTKPFTGLKEEINKINDFVSASVLALILAGIATIFNLIKTIITTVRVTSLWGNETSWVWDNIGNINFIKAIGLNFLLYLGIIFIIGGTYYLASLIIKKQKSFSTTLGIAVSSIIPMYISYTLISPILSILWAPLGIATTILGIVYSLIIIYELMSKELMLEGNTKFYLNLTCLGIITIVIYFVIMYLMLSDVATGLNSIFNI